MFKIEFVSLAFFAYGGVSLLMMLLGLFITNQPANSSGQVNNKLRVIVAFIAFAFVSVFGACTILISGIFFWVDIVGKDLTAENVVEIGEEKRSHKHRRRRCLHFLDAACSFDYSDSCTGCPGECPEWSEGEVQQVLRSSFKVVAALACILGLYSLTNIRTGFTWLNFFRQHKVEYI